MKRIFCIFTVLLLILLGASACINDTNPSESGTSSGTIKPSYPNEDNSNNNSEILIAYFSCTGTTEDIANHIIEKTSGARYQIQPKIPYSEEDLRYYHDCRADREQADSNARPEIEGNVEDMAKYQTVFIGYPIWHGQAPKIIYTFLESYDFSGKTIIPFCTSGSSGIGTSDTNLHSLAPNAEWKNGKRFARDASKASVNQWVNVVIDGLV